MNHWVIFQTKKLNSFWWISCFFESEHLQTENKTSPPTFPLISDFWEAELFTTKINYWYWLLVKQSAVTRVKLQHNITKPKMRDVIRVMIQSQWNETQIKYFGHKVSGLKFEFISLICLQQEFFYRSTNTFIRTKLSLNCVLWSWALCCRYITLFLKSCCFS